MTEVNEDPKTKYGPDCYNWKHNHGLEFVSRVLFELGHPDEPEETLFEVLTEVKKITDAYIISLKDARAINSLDDEVNFQNDRHKRTEIESRIEAREERLREEERVCDEIPW